jgi:hypothetical protein
MAGSYSFTRAARPGGAIVNHGQITALQGGYAVLAGEAVRNHGVVSAELGQVVLAGGTSFAMDLQGDRLISFQVTTPVETVAADGQAVLLNTGSLIANGGRVTLTAKAAEDVVTSVINTGGLIQATSAQNVNGTIVLEGDLGSVKVAGTLDVSGKGSGQSGGGIKVFGRYLELSAASLDATGDAGGGEIYVGGGWQGASIDGRLSARSTTISADSVLDASALTKGKGGTVVAWSDVHDPRSVTSVAGALQAKGGAQGGDGGAIETSGFKLKVDGIRVSTLAPKGKTGTWLLDPTNIWIATDQAAATAAGMAGTNSSANTGPATFQASGTPTRLAGAGAPRCRQRWAAAT